MQQELSGGSKKWWKKKGKANVAQEPPASSTPTESAGAASIHPSSSPSSLPDTWNANTGATSHMTPNWNWFKSYAPSSVPIRVANEQVIFSAGVGTVEFAPVRDGRNLCPVVFSNVLHVPSLNQDLLSILPLTSNHQFHVQIDSNSMEFVWGGVPCFYASVKDKVALLSGSTVVQSSEFASLAQATGHQLWHHQFGHISSNRLKSLVEHDMVSGLSLPKASTAPSSAPVCPACMEGKQTQDPFPPVASHRSVPLELVHSDLHGPLPPTANGYKYWISFTDDASHFQHC